MEADFREAFARRSHDEWAAHFAETGACVTPVLSMPEAPQNLHNPAPRTMETLSAVSESRVASIDEAVLNWKGENQ